MKAAKDQQLKLLELQQIETIIDQLNYKAKHLPEVKELDSARAAVPIAENELINRKTTVADLQILVKRADADVEQVRIRIERDSALIDGGTLSAKDIVNMQHELETLKRRQLNLEDEELEIMAQVEQAQLEVNKFDAEFESAKSRLDVAATAADALLKEIDAGKNAKQIQAKDLRTHLDAELLKLYDKIKSDQSGVGAAALKGKTCEGCRIEISATDLAVINLASSDDVIRCDECRRILVR